VKIAEKFGEKQREEGRGQNIFPWGGRKYGAGAGDGHSGAKAWF